jgi:hypothetical protein
MPGPAQHPFSDAPWLLNPGDSVRIHNFTARPELNDLIGKVVSYEKAKGRFAVEVPGLPNVMLFKLANLQLSNVPTPPTRAPVVDACPQTNDALAAFSENPGVSYTQYRWEAQLVDFAAEVLEGAPVGYPRTCMYLGTDDPRMVTPAGQIERWRMVYAGTPDEMGMKLHPALDADCTRFDPTRRIELVQYARDGITLPRYYRNDTVWVSPGYRVDTFVAMPTTPQTLCLVGRRPFDPLGSVIAVVEVRGDRGAPTATQLPPESVVSRHAPPVTWPRWLHMARRRGAVYSSCAISTWSCACLVVARLAKMSRMTSLRSMTLTASTAFSWWYLRVGDETWVLGSAEEIRS